MSGRSDNVVRLGCAEQAAIAEELRQHWQHVVDEGVPEHLLGLIAKFPDDVDRQPEKVRGAAEHVVQPAAQSAVVLLADFRPGERESPA
jgi:anti-sigma factor NepR-like protein